MNLPTTPCLYFASFAYMWREVWRLCILFLPAPFDPRVQPSSISLLGMRTTHEVHTQRRVPSGNVSAGAPLYFQFKCAIMYLCNKNRYFNSGYNNEVLVSPILSSYRRLLIVPYIATASIRCVSCSFLSHTTLFQKLFSVLVLYMSLFHKILMC